MEKATKKRNFPATISASADLTYLLYIDLVNGLTKFDIMKKINADMYEGFPTAQYSKTHKYRIIQNAYNMAKEVLDEEMHKQREIIYNRLGAVYADCMEHNDRNGALKALDQLAKIAGLYESKLKVDAKVGNEITISFGFEKEGADEGTVQA